MRGSAARAQEAARGGAGGDRVDGARATRAARSALRVHARAATSGPSWPRSLVLAGLDLLRFDRGASRLESIFIQLARSDGQAADANGADGNQTITGRTVMSRHLADPPPRAGRLHCGP